MCPKMLFSPDSLPWPRARLLLLLRRSETLAATARAICCLLAISVPNLLFVLESALHP